MIFSAKLEEELGKYNHVPSVRRQIEVYFAKNSSARAYLEVCSECNWPLLFDHLTIRTHSIDEAAKQYEKLGWKFDTSIDYRSEGWWAKIYRQEGLAPFFIDESYKDAPEEQKIIEKWVNKFGDQELHHIAMRIPQGVEIEQVVQALESKGCKFPGKITGPKGTQLRQIFSQAEMVDGMGYSVLELAQRGIDRNTGKTYEGFISEQADSLMKDSVL
jgi:catechol 2,3-dioxygenase-like lactoylglutathione lyase family enzyme